MQIQTGKGSVSLAVVIAIWGQRTGGKSLEEIA